MKEFLKQPNVQYWGRFIGKTAFYFGVLLVLIYLYHYKNIDGGTFIYNEF
ncbi:teichoic acid D-Ala incorporation-associated protein DltX [Enterococcus quebecensis]|uniref:D-alanyl-lipoteichoic acid biosynthesis protein n=1 Tax=Enterococcus quebecensis TaxID=903983 RepID=A0A1E5GQ72_9ENTE|nr:teichoic acid D-Ala incorporation-associated protein DltX [Enterococcus quebecensis]OEG14847.1 D-alanyl-lipoteichoic acid biosynthesis protein [Enterococcus quebecensis]